MRSCCCSITVAFLSFDVLLSKLSVQYQEYVCLFQNVHVFILARNWIDVAWSDSAQPPIVDATAN